MQSLQAQLLVAIPHLPDSNFYRSVVLMIQHDIEGAFGLILNRPSGIPLSQVWEQVSGNSLDSDLQLHVGGPVEGPLMVLHTNAKCADAQVTEGIYLSSQKQTITPLVESHERPLRIFNGYAGWAPQQLEAELANGGWFIAPCQLDYVFGDHDDLWKSVTEDIGQRILLDRVDAKRVPPDPSWN